MDASAAPLELGIAWLLDHAECSSVIVGARTSAQLDQNVTAAEWTLSPEERDGVRRLALGQPND